MPDNPLENYVSSSIKSTFQNIIHRGSDGILYGGSGSLIDIALENLPTTGISASYLHNFDSKLNSSSISERLDSEEILSGVLLSASASLSRYNVDSGSFNDKIDSKLNTSSFDSFTVSYDTTSASLSRYNADSGSFNSRIDSKLNTSSYQIDSSSFGSSLNNKVDINSNAYLQGVLFNTSSVAAAAAAQLKWNDSDGTLDLGLKGGNVTLQIGQEQVLRVVNKTGANLLESQYKVVKIKSATGQRPTVELAQATSDTKSDSTIGLAAENIDNNQEGFITISGIVSKIDTTGTLQSETWVDGDLLYLSAIAGGLTNVEPIAPIHSVAVGYVIYAHQINGKIYVKIDNVGHLNELHDVKIVSASNGHVLVYTGDFWENKELAGSFVTTSSFNSFTSSYQIDSGSFNSKIDSKLNTSSFNSFTSSLPPIGSTCLVNPNINGQTWLAGPTLLSKSSYPQLYSSLGDTAGVTCVRQNSLVDINGFRSNYSADGGIIVAGNGPGGISVSTDGNTWTRYTNTTGSMENATVRWVPEWSLYVLSANGGLYSSTDGMYWPRRLANITNLQHTVIHRTSITGNLRIVCPKMNPSGSAFRSAWTEDGINWTTGSQDVAAMNNFFSGTHPDGRIAQGHFYSHNGGTNWIVGTSPMSSQIKTFFHSGSGLWYVIGHNFNGSVNQTRAYRASHVTNTGSSLSWSQIAMSSGDGDGGNGSLTSYVEVSTGPENGLLFSADGGVLHYVTFISNTIATGVRFPEMDSNWHGLCKISGSVYAFTRRGKIWSCPENNPLKWSHVGDIPSGFGGIERIISTNQDIAVFSGSAYFTTLSGSGNFQHPTKVTPASTSQFGLPSIDGYSGNKQFIRVL